MRHGVLFLIACSVALVAWRIGVARGEGEAMHARETAARAMAERILRAEEQRRADSTKPGGLVAPRFAPYEYLSGLIAEHRIDGLHAVAGEREIYIAGGYLFHVRLINRLDRPLTRPPTDGSLEPSLGERFELWAWPADREDQTLSIFFASQSGLLLQGDNGAFAGADARPEDRGNPIKRVERGPDDAWIPILDVRTP